MQTITVALPYDSDIGDFDRQSLHVLSELDRLVTSEDRHLPSKAVVTMTGTIFTDLDQVSVSVTLRQTVLYGCAGFLDWIHDAVDATMPEDAELLKIILNFDLTDDNAVLLKAAWPSTLPRLKVTPRE